MRYVRTVGFIAVAQFVLLNLAQSDTKVRSGLLRFNVAAESFEMRSEDNTNWERIDLPLGDNQETPEETEKNCSAGRVSQSSHIYSWFVMAPSGKPAQYTQASCKSPWPGDEAIGIAQLQCDGKTGTWRSIHWNCDFYDPETGGGGGGYDEGGY